MTNTRSATAPLRPWPLGLPLLNALRRDPLGVAMQLHNQCGDIAWLKILGTRVCYLYRPELVRQVLVEQQADFLKDERVLSLMQQVHGTNVITTDGAVWERQRRILAPAFAPNRIGNYANLMAAGAREGVELELPSQVGVATVVDVDGLTTRITMDVILRALFGYHGNREQAIVVSSAVRGLTRQLMREFFWPIRPAAWLPYPGRSEKAKNLAVIRSLIGAQIATRRNQMKAGGDAGKDILGLLLTARDAQTPSPEGMLSDQEIHDNCIGLFGAGHDTSASALTWWIGLMAVHPDVARQVRGEVRAFEGGIASVKNVMGAKLLNATLKEVMRLYPPSTATFSRRAVRDVRIGDEIIAKDTLVVMPIWSLHRDPRWFPEPEAFRPDRFMPGAMDIPRSAFMPFGVGPHFCLGQHFAMVEMALIAATLITSYDLALDTGHTLPEPEVDLVLKPRESLLVRFTRCS